MMEFRNGIVEMVTEPITTEELLNGEETVIVSIKDNSGSNLYAIPAKTFMAQKPEVKEQVFYILNDNDFVEVNFTPERKCKVYIGITSISPYR